MKYITQTFIWILAGMLLLSCTEKGKRPESKPDYKTMKVERSTQTLKSRYTARLTGRQIVEVRPQISGNIMRICINEGDKVHKGQPLFIIDQVPYRAALQVASANVESAKARLATAQLNMESARALENNKVVSDFEVKTQQNALQEARAALSLAKAQELNARNNLSYTVVRSAMNGVAGMIPYHVGALVSSSISEPFGLTALEAAHHGDVLILTKQSGVSEIIWSALKYDFWDEKKLADEILAVAENPALRKTLQSNVKHEYRKISWNQVAKKCLKIYNRNINFGFLESAIAAARIRLCKPFCIVKRPTVETTV